MAVRLRRLTDRCIFCALTPPRSAAPPRRRPPHSVETARFRSVRGLPGTRVLSLLRERGPGRKISSFQLHTVVQAILDKIKPPAIDPDLPQQRFYDRTNADPRAYYCGLDTPARTLRRKFQDFSAVVLAALQRSEFSDHGAFFVSRADIEASIDQSQRGLGELLTRRFLDYVHISPRTLDPEARNTNLRKAADLRFPQEWYPVTRQFQRTWYLHVGPTNSGKTYHALRRLMESGSGCYAGPLRLLAHEVFERMNAEGIPCNLVTGDDRKIHSDLAQLTSCTVEMVNLSKAMEVCVLDEIQMIGDMDRGWAWTQALMGVKAQEVHLCGEERTVDLIRNLAATMGDKLVIRHYKRLGPLEVMPESLNGDLNKLERGDCIVTFSRKNIFAMQREIETVTGKKCAVIYGSLPPETRSIQAKLFNDPDNDYEILVASDAVGMGLNLSVKRMIFDTTVKWNGTKIVAVSVPAIKQIAGRAGRFRVAGAATPAVSGADIAVPLPAAPSVGYVTTLDREHHNALTYAMHATPSPLKTAGILPSSAHIEEFSALYPPNTPFDGILQDLQTYIATTPALFHLCNIDEHLKVARALRSIRGLSVAERLQFCMAPITSDPMVQDAAIDMAQCLADNKDASVLAIKSLDLDVLDIANPTQAEELRRLEGLHKALLLYLWLSWRFPATFTPRETAQDLKVVCERLIDLALKNIKMTRKKLVLEDPVEVTNVVEALKAPTAGSGVNKEEDDEDDENDEDSDEDDDDDDDGEIYGEDDDEIDDDEAEYYEGGDEDEDEDEEENEADEDEGESVVPREPSIKTDDIAAFEFIPKDGSKINIPESL